MRLSRAHPQIWIGCVCHATLLTSPNPAPSHPAALPYVLEACQEQDMPKKQMTVPPLSCHITSHYPWVGSTVTSAERTLVHLGGASTVCQSYRMSVHSLDSAVTRNKATSDCHFVSQAIQIFGKESLFSQIPKIFGHYTIIQHHFTEKAGTACSCDRLLSPICLEEPNCLCL